MERTAPAMAGSTVFALITYDVRDNTWTDGGNIKRELLGDYLAEYLRTQIGAGADDTPHVERDIYTIRVQCDLATDAFATSHNCGNKSLRDGILMNVVRQLA